MMLCSIDTAGITGIQGAEVTAECYISNGLPGFDIVGLPDAAVKEARDRVRAVAKSSGLRFPVSRITVNLAPASLKKAGTHYDLPILLSVLAASGAVRRPKSTSAFLGEVGLDGSIRSVSGVLPMALEAKRVGIQALFVPAENAAEATLADGPAVYPVRNVRELADAIADECSGMAAVFSGSDEAGYSYCLMERGGDLRQLNKAMTAALNGRGGGKPNFAQGSVAANEAQIRAFCESQNF